ncbi:MAG: ABC transporter ATP-binding protein [Ruminococcaceae bacterium]|nr:ABC transporter ATP-binding protein [Oscillospiraceae bacterium]
MKFIKFKDKELEWSLKRIKKFIPSIAFIAILNSLVSLSAVGLALVSKSVIDAATGHSENNFVFCAVILFAVLICELAAHGLSSIVNTRTTGKITISLRNYLFSSLVRKKYSNVSAYHTGDFLNRFTSDVNQIVGAAVSLIPSIASMATKLVSAITAMVYLNPTVALIVVVLGFTVPFLGRFISKKYKYMHKICQQTEGQATSFLQESFANIVVVKTFISELPILKKLNLYMSANYKAKVKRSYVSTAISLSLITFFNVGYYLVLVWGASAISKELITYGTLTAFLQLVSQVRAPLQNISGILPQYYAAMASAERLMVIDNMDRETPPIESDELQTLKENFQKVSVKNLAFAYDDEIILKNCSFEFERGKITALTGESGSGKSTLFKILLGLYEPLGGSVSFNDDIPINSSTRGMFAYVPQGNMILSGTIRENITLCNPNVSEEEIINAAKTAAIYDFITTLPDGFDTVLSERGAGLSEGQIQRISIARALLFDAPILLFDEATSALDEQTETTLLSNIKALPDKTVLFITHRNTSISVCDSIIHVENKVFTKIK